MTVKKHAILDGIDVVNIILLDDEDEYTPPVGHMVIPADSDDVAIGWTRVENTWVAPEEPPANPQPTEDPDVLAAKYEGVKELTDLGISESTARRIVGLPIEV
jgi:hypothetical protein